MTHSHIISILKDEKDEKDFFSRKNTVAKINLIHEKIFKREKGNRVKHIHTAEK